MRDDFLNTDIPSICKFRSATDANANPSVRGRERLTARTELFVTPNRLAFLAAVSEESPPVGSATLVCCWVGRRKRASLSPAPLAGCPSLPFSLSCAVVLIAHGGRSTR